MHGKLGESSHEPMYYTIQYNLIVEFVYWHKDKESLIAMIL